MALKPENPVVGGTVLRRQAIRSPNFITGVSGWTINQDGSVEFNNGTFRGTVTAGTFVGTHWEATADGIFFWNGVPGSGNPPIFFVVRPGVTTDPFGNSLLVHANAGAVFGAGTRGGGEIVISQQGVMTFDNGVAVSSLSELLPLANASLEMQSGQIAGADNVALLNLWAKGDSPQNVPQVSITRGAGFSNPGTPALLDLGGSIGLQEVAAPTTPAAGFSMIYQNSADHSLHLKRESAIDLTIPGTQVENASHTVIQAVATALTQAWPTDANVPVGTVYRIRCGGTATWGSTQQQLTLECDASGAGTLRQLNVAAAAFAASTPVDWDLTVEVRVGTTGVSGSVSCRMTLSMSVNNAAALTTNGIASVRRTVGITFNTTTGQTLTIKALWAATTGAPTITNDYSTFERIGP
jgi:hypothetical protein